MLGSKTTETGQDVLFEAPREIIEPMLGETWRYPEFISSIEGAKLLEGDWQDNRAEFQARMVIDFSYVMHTYRPSEDVFAFEQESGFFSRLSGEWRLCAPDEAGRIPARYAIRVATPPLVPGGFIKTALESWFPRMIKEFEEEARRRAAAAKNG